MVTLYNAESGTVFGTVSADDLAFLSTHLEEEGVDDQDYWINPTTVDLLAERGASQTLLGLLRGAVGDNEEGVEIGFREEP